MLDTMSLAGRWRIALDRKNDGIRKKWYARKLKDSISLPGTTDEARIGEFANEHCVDRLSRIWRWIGPAWYQKTVTIPKHWEDKKIVLFLERTKDSQVWVDDTWVGSDDSLSTPHVFDCSDALTPGRHTITILVDNAKLPPVGPCHQVDERTQTNWNGIVGKIELRMMDRIRIDDLQVFPNVKKSSVKVLAVIENDTDWTGKCELTSKVSATKRTKLSIKPQCNSIRIKPGRTCTTFVLALPKSTPCWDEFVTSLLKLTVEIKARVCGRTVHENSIAVFGMRTFGTRRSQFVINGRPTLLRGKNDCALFPLTGYAPMDKAEWLRLLKIAKSYGINHYRFHSWCPPEAAFAAADELGIYLQPELPNKREITSPGNRDYKPPAEAYETLAELDGDAGPPAVRTAYLTREGERILKQFGNHPSFAMMTLGNELGGDVAVMDKMCDHFRSLDKRHLYARGTGAFHWDIKYREGDDFWVTRATAKGVEVRGASWESENHIDHRPPSTTVDYRKALKGVPVPVVGHEMAQYEVFPIFEEAKKYTGVLKARFFETFRKRLKTAGMLDQASDFVAASGAVSAICHREDVEAALRTPGFGGFQMLDLQDFSGQGVALVGMLDVFMDSKGLISPKKWSEFCCETVPLLRMKKYTWTNDETFRGRIQVAHYGPTDLRGKTVAWQITQGRRVLAKGRSSRTTIASGKVTDIDQVSATLNSIRKAKKLVVSLQITGTTYKNSYSLWVYPARQTAAVPDGIVISRKLTKKAETELNRGGSVLLLPDPEKITRSVESAFQSSFWSPMFRKPGRLSPLGRETPGTQGLLCDPKHPMFKEFPTEFHTNWQWWQLVKNGRPMILDSTPRTFRPTLQMVDGFDRNHKLGFICEATVGKGKLLVCSIDLLSLQQYPEARQLLLSITNYMQSGHFTPKHRLTARAIRSII